VDAGRCSGLIRSENVTQRRETALGIVLTNRQRDFLASYPDNVEVEIVEQDEEGRIRVEAGEELEAQHQDFWVPREGFLTQPLVDLRDPYESIPDFMPGVEEE
jgi:hypothetical protein